MKTTKLILVVLLVALHLRAPACGYLVLGEDFRIALFNPYLIGEEYAEFFYSSDRFHRAEGQGRASRDRQRNVADWASELGGNVSSEAVMEMLYRTSFADYLAVVERGENRPLAQNPAWKAVIARPELLEYLMWAKAYEVPRQRNYYDWSDLGDEVEEVGANVYTTKFRERAVAGYRAASGEWLKRRYAYQLLLLGRYAKSEQTVEQYFQPHFAGRNDVLSDWARFHRASLRRPGPERFVELARAFRVTPEKALAVFQMTPDEIDPEDYLFAAKTDAQKSDVYALAAVKSPGKALEYVKIAHHYNPGNETLPLLIAREINKLEDWMLSFPLTGYGPSVPNRYYPPKEELRRANALADRAHLEKLRGFLRDLVLPGTDAKLLQLFRAQTDLLAGDYAQAASADPNDGAQSAILALVGLANGPRLQEAATTERIVGILAANQAQFTRGRSPRNLFPALNRIVSQAYERAGDTTLAYLFYNRSLELVTAAGWSSEYYRKIDYLDRDISPQTMNSIISYLKSPPQAEVGAYLSEGHDLGAGPVLDLAGTQALRRNEPERALAYFEQLSPGFYDTAYNFSYYLPGGKTQLTRDLVALERRAAAGERDAIIALGDAWYDMSYYGQNWMMLAYGQSSYPPESSRPWPLAENHAATPHNERDYTVIYRGSYALQNWQRAAALTTEPELLARLEYKFRELSFRIAYQQLSWSRYQTEDRKDQLYHQYFGPLAENYRETEFYRGLLQQCGWFSARFD